MRRDADERPARRGQRHATKGALRLFVALYPPQPVVAALFEALAREPLPPHRTTPLDQVHLTAHFVGEVDERQLDAVVESVRAAARGVQPFELAPLHLAPLPENGPARLVAALTSAPSALVELHERLVARLARGRRKGAAFLPHLTLARFDAPTRCEVATPLVHVPPFAVDAVHLMQSRIGDGAVHHRGLVRVELGQR